MFTPRDQKRLNKIMEEFRKGFEFLDHSKGVVIFGSARKKACEEYYDKAYDIARQLAAKGFNIITGAGPGIMEAANKGAKEVGGKSVGLNIVLPNQQDYNDYINQLITFEHFYVRKVMFTKYSFATVVMPGGYGTLDELFEQLVLLQNRKIKNRPLILFGTKFYGGMISWIKEVLYKQGYINKEDCNRLIKLTDSVDEVVAFIEEYYKNTNPTFFI